MNRQYKALLMDVDGTLLDFDRAEAAAFTKVLQKYGFVPEERFIQEYHKINQECWEAFEIGQMERDRVLTVRFERFFGGHGPVSYTHLDVYKRQPLPRPPACGGVLTCLIKIYLAQLKSL